MVSYFGCGKQRHVKVDCPSLLNKETQIRRRPANLKKVEKHIYLGKTMLLLLAALHMRRLKLTCVLWLEKTMR